MYVYYMVLLKMSNFSKTITLELVVYMYVYLYVKHIFCFLIFRIFSLYLLQFFNYICICVNSSILVFMYVYISLLILL